MVKTLPRSWFNLINESLNLRPKYEKPDKDVMALPKWNYDGSSTGQAQGSNSDCYLKPVRIFPDPFRCDPHILVLCEVLDSDKNPAATNHRFSYNKTMTGIILLCS